MLNQIDKLKDDISKLKEENDKKIIILAKVHLMELENLQRENEKLRHELASVFKFHCTFCNSQDTRSYIFKKPYEHKSRQQNEHR